ncbi:hypothetical protein CBW65_12850 [Tumebacillus avium]|uniref:Uncharacterized protein n=1 Tax=Tumebacillus avium TaxID=1903704 RepID=A0A1Y0IP89_9BACL|nr:hypothetical protein [Tumebacillus avium]ARU61819.1 hypothetical protein CBW65_12850 [Tumebacillus avium]
MWPFSQDVYSLEDIYGIGEVPPEDCPTYIERKAHKSFVYTVQHEKQHIVVYGASRQGKSWLIEKYCPNFIRVGCDAKFTRESLFKAMLHELNIKVGSLQRGKNSEKNNELQINGAIQLQLPLFAKSDLKAGGKAAIKKAENESFTYVNIDLENQSEVITAISEVIGDKFIVLENFHYLEPSVQKTFASSLKEFLYYPIRVVIVGVWKETTKLVSLASDLTNRVEPIDIGDWTKDELLEIVSNGDKALNTYTDSAIIEKFIEHSGRNVGIFKSLMKNYCKLHGVYQSQKKKTILSDHSLADEALEKSYQEVVVPALDRLHKLARSKKSGGKGLRYYIVKSLLEIMTESDIDKLVDGILVNHVIQKVQSNKEVKFQQQNIKQELLILHTREETVASEGTASTNFIPLFYFDQGKDRVFIVESALLAACRSGKVDLSNVLGPKTIYVK